MSISHPPVVKIKEHCNILCKVLHGLSYQAPPIVTTEGETYGWAQPADWLDLAASVIKVDVLTAQDDQSLHMCESAMDYENDRSALLTQFATSLTVFSFVWGAFESVANIVNPLAIPKPLRTDGNNSLTARVAFALKAIKPDGVYYCCLANIRHRLVHHPEYNGCVPIGLGAVTDADAGEGIDLVRRIRNKFAHGAATLPQRGDWNGHDSMDNQLIRLSCRMVLLTIQFMLRVYFQGRSIGIEVYDFNSDSDEQEIHVLLQSLHFVGEPIDDASDRDEQRDQSGETA